VIRRCVTSVSSKQPTEDPIADFERLGDGRARAFHGRVRVSPGSQMFFRPEEVDGRSERIERLA
jgi:hypothetical protein